ncbi:MAG TPA: biotin/lipoyl-binding protein [Terriglobales bacterium]|nr:biotin/lipoyl-binding protein [Terriglobales bacterium]
MRSSLGLAAAKALARQARNAGIESLAPRVAGTVAAVDVNDNQIVRAGQI